MARKQKKVFTTKERVTIWIKKSKPMPLYVCLLLCVALFVGLVVVGKMDTVEKAKAPAALTTSKVQMRMTFTGDVEISDDIRTLANEIGYKSLLRGLVNYWKDSDYVVTNISGPVLEYNVDNYTSTREADENSYFVRPAAVRGLQKAGIDIMGFANDDAYNYGITGIRSTIRIMDQYAMEYIGIRPSNVEPIYTIKEYEYISDTGVSQTRNVAVFAVNNDIMKNSSAGENKAGITNTSLSDLYIQIYEVAQTVDDVIAYVHFNEAESVQVTDEQREIARALIDAGADLVIGNSTTMQTAEKYNRGLILYGVGSLITDEFYTDNLDSVLVDYVVRNSGETIVYLTPIRVENGRPQVTQNSLHMTRIQSIITSGLGEGDYRIMDDGIIRISLGKMINTIQDETSQVQN